jgi:redox-sensitive bicupin YhaK (pirin superfamily)
VLNIRRAEDRGHANHGWLDTHHTFSFADYHDRRFMGFGPLRVINDDVVAAGAGFPPHSHRDMEIVTYVLAGQLEHRDSLGNGSIIVPGDVQRMSAGTGVTHSEYNPSDDEPLHLLQIWILPRRAGLKTGYEQKHFGDDDKRGRLRLVASPDGADDSVRIEQDVRLFATIVEGGQEVSHELAAGRKAWLHVARGEATVNGVSLVAGDGAAIAEEARIAISSARLGEVLLFDLP